MNKVFLRALDNNDLEYTHKWHSDHELYSSLVGPFRYVSKDAEKMWLLDKTNFSNQEINLMICLEKADKPIGMISLREIDWIAKKGRLTGIVIGEKQNQGQGYGFQALNLLIKHCFEDLGLNRIWTLILSDNEPSRSLFQKCGFQVEGLLRQHAYKHGQFQDVVIVALCSDQYLSHTNN